MSSGVMHVILAFTLSLGVLASGCRLGASSPGKEAPAPAASQSGPTGSASPGELLIEGEATQSHEANAVTIEAEPSGKLIAGSRELTFKVAMNTHSVNLDGYDLKGRAVLRDGLGREFKPTSWQAPQGGHHRSGVLIFASDQPLLLANSHHLELYISDVANASHSLRWDLRPAS